ncbi:MAG: aromatic amino acid ammonia-lyase [Myxococcales bacterium]|nr:aromatic amino acid ammonia-lyase [Myxococcales bacterium]
MSEIVELDGESLTLAVVDAIARGAVRVRLADGARQRMAASYQWVTDAAQGRVVDDQGAPLTIYGVNTGYGSLARVRIDSAQIQELSWNLVQSHAAGVGPAMDAPCVRAMMVLRANALAKGASGCRPELVDLLCDMLDADVVPEIPSRGSCGSSGDLAPLAHLGLVMFRGPQGPGQAGFAWFRGERWPAAEAMRRAGLTQLVPGPKEGLAITNGAQLTCAMAALGCHAARSLVKVAEIAAAMSFEALRGTTRALHPDVHRLRPFPGAIQTASDLRQLLAGSQLADSVPEKVQDAYSLRCTPQVMGAVRDALTYAIAQVSVELNAATDNPLILLDADSPDKAFSAGLFHGEPVGFAADHAKLALCELAALSERRIYRLTTGNLSSRLPPLLADGPGLGLMLPQVAAAALVAENRRIAMPSSVDSLPTCEDQEDHVAMSTTAAHRFRTVLANAQQVVAIELLSATKGLWVRHAEDPTVVLGKGTQAALTAVESVLGGAHTSIPADDLAALVAAVRDGRILEAVEGAVGSLASVGAPGEVADA